jgi:clan AA aspartic protease
VIVGAVTSDGEAVIELTVRGPTGQVEKTRVVIDTGYDGYLTLPPSLIRWLQLAWKRSGIAELADGSQCQFDIYEAMVTWHGRRCSVAVDEADTDPLVGMSLLKGSELKVQVRKGGKVSIKRLP